MKKQVYYRDLDLDISVDESYRRLSKNSVGMIFEQNLYEKKISYLCVDPIKIIKDDENILDRIKDEIKGIKVESSRPYIGGAYGNFSYDTVKDYEKLPTLNNANVEVPRNNILIVDRGLVVDHLEGKSYLSVVSSDESEAIKILDELEKRLKIPSIKDEKKIKNGIYKTFPTRNEYMDGVNKAKKYIKDGDIFQVVLSMRFEQESNINPYEFYERLKKINPSPYTYYLDLEEYQIIGSSPEKLVSVKDGCVKTVPIAGTRKRGKDKSEDDILARELLEDEKEIAEHRMLVDLARNDIGRISKVGSVEVTRLMEIEKYSHVMHIVSEVEGRLEKDSFESLSSILPAGTLSGAPKIRAMEIIEEIEDTSRGYYGGGIGYINYSGEMDTCIAIRTALHKDEKYYFQAGAGIVHDSIPENEYDECLNKSYSIKKIFEEAEDDSINR